MAKNIDKETQKALNDAEEIRLMTETRGWILFQKKLSEKILELQMISNVVGNTPAEKVRSMEINQKTAILLFEILSDIVSTPDQVKNNLSHLLDENETFYDVRS
jgi:hypothetical protein